MVNVVSKIYTHRIAIAKATLKTSSLKTIEAIKNNQIAKGNVFEMSKAAGLLGVKKTSDVIPDCHPMPIEYTKISHEINDLDIEITVEVHTLYKTGVEVEAMYGASVTAITMYDMLKPIDKGVSIERIFLSEKHGGKTDFKKDTGVGLKSAVIVISDSIANGKKKDLGGQVILATLSKFELQNLGYEIIHDNADVLKETVNKYAKDADLIIVSGGTGLTKKDITPETLRDIIDIEIPGIMEAARNYGQQRTPYAMFSRGFAGTINGNLLLAIPGSTNGVKETLDALFPYVLHVFKMLRH